MVNLDLPAKFGDKSLREILSQPGAKVTIEPKNGMHTMTVKYKEPDFNVSVRIEIYPDGTKRESRTISAKIPAKEKKPTMKAMQKEGKTQQQIADETGHSQATVSRVLND